MAVAASTEKKKLTLEMESNPSSTPLASASAPDNATSANEPGRPRSGQAQNVSSKLTGECADKNGSTTSPEKHTKDKSEQPQAPSEAAPVTTGPSCAIPSAQTTKTITKNNAQSTTAFSAEQTADTKPKTHQDSEVSKTAASKVVPSDKDSVSPTISHETQPQEPTSPALASTTPTTAASPPTQASTTVAPTSLVDRNDSHLVGRRVLLQQSGNWHTGIVAAHNPDLKVSWRDWKV